MKHIDIGSFWLAASVAVTSLACNLVSAMPSLLDSAGETPTAEAPLLVDDFSNSESGWGTGTDSDSAVEYEDGGLRMTAFRDNFFTWSNPDAETYGDVHMEVTVKNEGGGTRVGFGIMCDQQTTEAAYHYIAVTTDGDYVIGRSAVGKEDVFLTNNDDWASSSLISAGAASYRIGADCSQGNLTLYVNGEKVDTVSDPTYTEGSVGLFLWSGDDPSGAVSYDDFVMTSLK